ncbi:MAG: P-II family nitrogen regulator [Deltaproteobacteria bacterium]|nr:P-II family nitrogen regulator [Deltaproteobacteria bacterium]
MKMIWAVIRSSKVDLVTGELKNAGVGGYTVCPVKGCGEVFHLYGPVIHGGHHQLEAVVEDNQVEKAVEVIAKNAATGLEGDGVVAVLDIVSFTKIRPHWSSTLDRRNKTHRAAA